MLIFTSCWQTPAHLSDEVGTYPGRSENQEARGGELNASATGENSVNTARYLGLDLPLKPSEPPPALG